MFMFCSIIFHPDLDVKTTGRGKIAQGRRRRCLARPQWCRSRIAAILPESKMAYAVAVARSAQNDALIRWILCRCTRVVDYGCRRALYDAGSVNNGHDSADGHRFLQCGVVDW